MSQLSLCLFEVKLSPTFSYIYIVLMQSSLPQGCRGKLKSNIGSFLIWISLSIAFSKNTFILAPTPMWDLYRCGRLNWKESSHMNWPHKSNMELDKTISVWSYLLPCLHWSVGRWSGVTSEHGCFLSCRYSQTLPRAKRFTKLRAGGADLNISNTCGHAS